MVSPSADDNLTSDQSWKTQLPHAAGPRDHLSSGEGNGSSSLTITGGDFTPTQGYDGSSVFVTNGTNDILVSVTGGKFNTKIGCNAATKAGIKGAVKGGVFTEAAKANTAAALLAEGYAFNANQDGTYTVVKQN